MSTAPSTLPSFDAGEQPPFRPKAATDFASAGLSPAMVESLVLKFLLGVGVATGRRIADELGLPFGPFPEFLRGLKAQPRGGGGEIGIGGCLLLDPDAHLLAPRQNPRRWSFRGKVLPWPAALPGEERLLRPTLFRWRDR